MKRVVLLPMVATTLLMLASCSPQTYQLSVESRYPSASGLDIGDKSVSIVYLEDGSKRDSIVCSNIADGLAQGLESEFKKQGLSRDGVDVFSIETSDNYSSKDSLVSLIMQTGSDIVIMLDHPRYSESEQPSKVLCSTSVYAYDSMSPRDHIITTESSTSISAAVVGESMLPSDAQIMGLGLSKEFFNKWTPESYSVIYFPTIGDEWYDALGYAADMRWDEAMSIWMDILKHTPNDIKTSCACYNMALGCFMCEQYKLASDWLDLSDRTKVLSLSKGLRSRIEARL